MKKLIILAAIFSALISCAKQEETTLNTLATKGLCGEIISSEVIPAECWNEKHGIVYIPCAQDSVTDICIVENYLDRRDTTSLVSYLVLPKYMTGYVTIGGAAMCGMFLLDEHRLTPIPGISVLLINCDKTHIAVTSPRYHDVIKVTYKVDGEAVTKKIRDIDFKAGKTYYIE